MSWASRRRTLYASGVVTVLLLIVGVPLFLFLYQAPNCFDGKQNQGETAIDLGGPCVSLDKNSLQQATILFSRATEIRTGEYAAVAYVQNPNRSAAALSVPYHFVFYDNSNILVSEKRGSISLAPGEITPVYVPTIYTGNRKIVRAFFELTDEPAWVRAGNPAKALTITDTETADLTTSPRIETIVTNTDVTPRKDITVVATVFDGAGTAFAVSQTVLENLAGGEQARLVFTWPQAFNTYPARIDIIPLIAPEIER